MEKRNNKNDSGAGKQSNDTFAALVKAKIAAGLPRRDAEECALAQIAEDAKNAQLAKAAK